MRRRLQKRRFSDCDRSNVCVGAAKVEPQSDRKPRVFRDDDFAEGGRAEDLAKLNRERSAIVDAVLQPKINHKLGPLARVRVLVERVWLRRQIVQAM